MTQETVLELKGVKKFFPGVKALDGVSFTLKKGEIHALLGENGAGKSTLIKILTGAYEKTAGEIIYNNENITNMTPHQSKTLGINAIYQELTLFPEMTAAQNVYMGSERQHPRYKFMDDVSMNHEVSKLFKRIKLNIPPTTLVKNLSVAQQQMIEIARALSLDTKVLIMDEPTSSITKKDTEILFSLIKELREEGVSIIYISHRMEEIFSICDRVTVMRDGKVVETLRIDDVASTEQLVNLMVNKEIDDFFPKVKVPIGDVILSVNNLSSSGTFENVSFDIRKGEIFGIGGLVGSKRSEIAEAVFGLRFYEKGSIEFNGELIHKGNPESHIGKGIGFISEDRKGTGLILSMSVKENITLPGLRLFGKIKDFFVDESKEQKAVATQVERLRVKTPSIHQRINELSGGNQQKALIARWLLLNPRLLIMDEPTRGIDVGAKSEIYKLMGDLVGNGVSILMISSEIPELLAMSDRIMVMREGRISGFLTEDNKTEENILTLAFGGKINDH